MSIEFMLGAILGLVVIIFWLVSSNDTDNFLKELKELKALVEDLQSDIAILHEEIENQLNDL